MNRVAPVVSLVLAAGLLCGGCSPSGPTVEYVEGVVTLDGQPIEGVTVTFSPVDAKTGTSAVGTTDASGIFKLTSIPDGAHNGGAKAGDYNVAFSKVAGGAAGAAPLSDDDDPNYGKSPASGKTESIKSERIVPEKYENPATSGFKATVKPGTNKGEGFKFDLKKQ